MECIRERYNNTSLIDDGTRDAVASIASEYRPEILDSTASETLLRDKGDFVVDPVQALAS